MPSPNPNVYLAFIYMMLWSAATQQHMGAAIGARINCSLAWEQRSDAPKRPLFEQADLRVI